MALQNLNNLPTFSGTSSWQTFDAQFESFAKYCKWNDDEKLIFLGLALKDAAAEFAYSELSDFDRDNYRKLRSSLQNRYQGPENTCLLSKHFGKADVIESREHCRICH